MIFSSSRKRRAIMTPQTHSGTWEASDYPEIGLAQAIVLWYGALVVRCQVGRASRALKKVKESTKRSIKRCKATKLHFLPNFHSQPDLSRVTHPFESVASIDGTSLLCELAKYSMFKSKYYKKVTVSEEIRFLFSEKKCLVYSVNPFDALFLFDMFHGLFHVQKNVTDTPSILKSFCFLFLGLEKCYEGSVFSTTTLLPIAELNKDTNQIHSLTVDSKHLSTLVNLSTPLCHYSNVKKCLKYYDRSYPAESLNTSASRYLLELPHISDFTPRSFPNRQRILEAPHIENLDPFSQRPPLRDFPRTRYLCGDLHLAGTFNGNFFNLHRDVKHQLPFRISQNWRIRGPSLSSSSIRNVFIPSEIVDVSQEQGHSPRPALLHEKESDLSTLVLTVFDRAEKKPNVIGKLSLIEIGLPDLDYTLSESFHLESEFRLLQPIRLRSSVSTFCGGDSCEVDENVLSEVDVLKEHDGNKNSFGLKCDFFTEKNITNMRLLSTYDQPSMLSTSYTNVGIKACNTSIETESVDSKRNTLAIQDCVPLVSGKPCQLVSGTTTTEMDNSVNIKPENGEEEESYTNSCKEGVNGGPYEVNSKEEESKLNTEFDKKMMPRAATDNEFPLRCFPGISPNSLYPIDVPQTSSDRWEVRKGKASFEIRKLRADEDFAVKEVRKVQFADEVLLCTYKRKDKFEFIGRNDLPPIFRHMPTKGILKEVCKSSKDAREELPKTSFYNLVISNTFYNRNNRTLLKVPT